MIDANNASSSANEVSIRTCVFSSLARISRVASMPLPSARRTSMTTTSGRVRSAWAIASTTVPASATTVMSSFALMSALTPSRTTSWSSTRRMRSLLVAIGAIVASFHPGRQRRQALPHRAVRP